MVTSGRRCTWGCCWWGDLPAASHVAGQCFMPWHSGSVACHGTGRVSHSMRRGEAPRHLTLWYRFCSGKSICTVQALKTPQEDPSGLLSCGSHGQQLNESLAPGESGLPFILRVTQKPPSFLNPKRLLRVCPPTRLHPTQPPPKPRRHGLEPLHPCPTGLLLLVTLPAIRPLSSRVARFSATPPLLQTPPLTKP